MWPQLEPVDQDEDLLAVMEALVAAPSRHALLSHFHRYVASLIPEPYVSLWILDEERAKRSLLLIDKFGSQIPTNMPEGQRIALEDDFVSRTLRDQEASVFDPQDHGVRSELPLPSPIAKEHLNWMMAVPISTSNARGIVLVGTRAGGVIPITRARSLRFAAGQVLILVSRLQQREADNAITRTIASFVQKSDSAHDLEYYLTNLIKAVDADGACIIAREQPSSDLSIVASMPFRHGDKKRPPDSEFLDILTRRQVRLFSLNAREQDDDLKLYGIRPVEVFTTCNWLEPAIREGDHFISAPFPIGSPTADARPQAGAVIVARRMAKLPFLRQDEDLLFTTAAFVNVLNGYKQKLQAQTDTLIAAKDVASASEIATVATAALLGAVNLTGADAGFVALQQDQDGGLEVIDVYGMPSIKTEILDFEAPAYIKAKVRNSLVADAHPSRRFLAYPPFSDPGMVEVLVPISRDNQLVGVLVLAVAEAIWSDNEPRRQALRLFAAQVGTANSELLLADRARKFEQRIEQIASEATASLVAISLAHEVKNAVNVLGIMLERLGPVATDLRAQTMEFRTRQKLAARLDEIRSSGSSEILRVSELANMVRDLTTGGSLVGSAPDEVVYLNDVVRLWARLLQDTADEYGVKINARYDAALDRPKGGFGHPCKVNRARLGQVIINLVTNALQASHPGSRLDLSTKFVDARDPNDRATLTVRDYGKGMEPEVKKRAFEMFYSTKEHGYGLGLPVVKTIIDAFGGTMEIRSEPGKGSSFIVGIPCR